MNIKALAEKAGFFTHKEVMPQIEAFACLVLEEAALVCMNQDAVAQWGGISMTIAATTQNQCAEAIRALGSKP